MFFQRGQFIVLVEIWLFLYVFFFLGNLGLENVGYCLSSLSFQSKCGQFSIFFWGKIQARTMCFTIFQNEKTALQAIKTRSSKIRRIDIFPKGLVHCFGQKLAFFPFSLFYAIKARKMCLQYSRTEKYLSSLERQEVVKVHGFGQKLASFPSSFGGEKAPSCNKLHQVAPNCIMLYQSAPSCTKVHKIASNYTKLHQTG